jgi:hypothetical protein
MQETPDLTAEEVEQRLAGLEQARDEERVTALEELHRDLESALAEIEGEQADPPGR